MKYEINGGSYSVSCEAYDIKLDGHIAAVRLCGTDIAYLDIRSAVNRCEPDNTVTVDREPDAPVLEGVSHRDAKVVFTWRGKSSLWDKIYELACGPLRFEYRVTVSGCGNVDSVNYFSGDIGGRRPGSEYEFQSGFNPSVSWDGDEDYYFPCVKNFSRWSVLMVPPMFCYSFKTIGITRQLALGLVAEKGEHNFHQFDYTCVKPEGLHNGFYLSTDQSGHTPVNGSWTAPYIIGYGSEDEFDSLKKYRDYYFASGIAEVKKQAPIPKFWRGPIACGWIQQNAVASKNKANPTEYATESVYNDYLDKLEKLKLYPKVLIIDDKWQKNYATDIADQTRFPDMRGFADKCREKGIHTLLWFKLWDPDGWDKSLCVKDRSGNLRIDPSNPLFVENLDCALHRILSSDKDCYNCDGMKLDFAFFNPMGRGFTTYSGKYGCELLYELIEHIYTKSKEIKPEALINCSPCHPYFAHLCDHARLHDYNFRANNNYEELSMRAKLFSIANPWSLMDCDNAGFRSHRDTMRWMLNQPLVGVPDLYTIDGTESMTLDADDWEQLSELWREYTAMTDKLY